MFVALCALRRYCCARASETQGVRVAASIPLLHELCAMCMLRCVVRRTLHQNRFARRPTNCQELRGVESAFEKIEELGCARGLESGRCISLGRCMSRDSGGWQEQRLHNVAVHS